MRPRWPRCGKSKFPILDFSRKAKDFSLFLSDISTFRFSSEQQSKAKMAAEIEELKRDYEDKLKEVTVSHSY